MNFSLKRSAAVLSAFLIAAGGSSLAVAEPLFMDDFEDRTAEQPTLGNNWTWYDQWFDGTSCEGAAAGGFGPFDDGDGSDYEQGNQNFANAGDDGGLYFRAGLEVPAWDGALSNMLRVYGNQYITYEGCHRVLIFQEMTVAEAGSMMLSFDVALDQFGAPANGEITGAFVKVLDPDNGYAEMIFERIETLLPEGTLTNKGYLPFTLAEEHVGKLMQFGFYNDVVPASGQSWSTSAALYDNVMLDMAGIGPAHSGSWYNDTQSGHGFSMEFGYTLDGSPNAVVYWYTYDSMGNPIFLLGTGTPMGDTVEIAFSSYVGMIYGDFAPAPPDRFDAGTGTFVFSDGDNGTFSYTPSDDSATRWGHATPVENLPIVKIFGVPASPVFETMQ